MTRARWIFQTLIFSIALNAILLCLLFYLLIKDIPVHFSYTPKEEVYQDLPPLSTTLLKRFHTFQFSELIEFLNDERVLTHGYRVKEFALGTLAAFHDFDVERALGRGTILKKIWEYNNERFLLFPNLSEEDFSALINFSKQETYPLTSQGLFKKIALLGIENCDTSLLAFFCHSPEFVLLETLFARAEYPIQKKTLLLILLEGGWENLSLFFQTQKEEMALNPYTRQKFLWAAIDKGSKTAAHVLLLTDFDFALHQLKDIEVAHLLKLVEHNHPEREKFLRGIVASPRASSVTNQASVLLNQPLEMHSNIAGHFLEKPGLKELRPVFRSQPPAAPSPTMHIVQPGESLWTIARKYQVPLETLMDFNHLSTTVIQSGKCLRIPPPP